MRSPSRSPLLRGAAVLLVAVTAACDREPAAPEPPRVLLSAQADTGPSLANYGAPQMLLGRPEDRPGGRTGSTTAVSATRLAAATTTSEFGGFYRYPAEVRNWVGARGDTAYFRDVFVGGDIDVYRAQDGDTWNASVTLPNGTVITWAETRFYSEYNGQRNCFVTGSSSLCGATSMWTRYYRGSQCGQTGDWRWTFTHNGEVLKDTTIRVLPQVDLGLVPIYSQSPYTDVLYDHTCKKNGVTYQCPDDDPAHLKFSQRGCAITSTAMMMTYQGMPILPTDLNAWMRTDSAFDAKGNAQFWKLKKLAKEVYGQSLTFDLANNRSADLALLRSFLCKYGPQVIAVDGTSHFVLATGWDPQRNTFLINDPAGGKRTTLRDVPRYSNTYSGIRPFIGQQYKIEDDLSGIYLTFHSPGELLVTDPLGRRLGTDPRTGQSYQEIPQGIYDLVRVDDDEAPDFRDVDPSKELGIEQPVNGEYTIEVVGTGTGTYDMTIGLMGSDPSRTADAAIHDVAIMPGVVHTYRIVFDKANVKEGPVPFTGGFSGGGQREDVDALLSYGAPSSRQTELPAGTSSYALMIFYDAGIDPSTFTAELNGADVSSLFHPAPGQSEIVTLPLTPGRNVFKAFVRGSVGRRTATDRDQLVLSTK